MTAELNNKILDLYYEGDATPKSIAQTLNLDVAVVLEVIRKDDYKSSLRMAKNEGISLEQGVENYGHNRM